MKLYIRFGSLARFQKLYDGSEYLQTVLAPARSNVYHIDADDTSEIRRLLKSRNINYEISDK